MAEISLEGLDKAAVLAALFNASRPQGMGFMHYDPTAMSVEEAAELLKRGSDFDYLKGRVMKVDLSGETFDPWLYDRDNGPDAAANAIDSLRDTNDANNVVIRWKHAEETRQSAEDAMEHLSKQSTFRIEGDLAIAELGLGSFAEQLKPKLEDAIESSKTPLDE